MASSSVDGVLLDIALPSDLNALFNKISQMEDFKVILFSEALEPKESGLVGVHCQHVNSNSTPRAAEAGRGGTTVAYQLAEAHASRFESMGIRLVACRELGSLACLGLQLHRSKLSNRNTLCLCASCVCEYTRACWCRGLCGSEKGISPVLREALLDHGIVPLQRLSLRHIHTVQAICGCSLMAHLSSTVS